MFNTVTVVCSLVTAWLSLSPAFGQVVGPITPHFQSWLTANGYNQPFARTDLGAYGSYGGKSSASQPIQHQPVIFVHGNSDMALNGGRGTYETGWTNTIQYFQSQGYSSAEMYATTWGDANPTHAASRTHNCVTVQYLRSFVQAVIAYTNATKVDIISHSMGVTLARKLIKGGQISANDGSCSVGSSLTSNVDTFLGLAGGNYGLCNCEGTAALFEQTCNKQDGYWPGDNCGFNYYDCGLYPLPLPCANPTYSTYLTNLNNSPIREGQYVFAAWSSDDDIILYGDWVWGRYTSSIPGMNGHKIYSGKTHMQTKDTTAVDQYSAVVNHVLQ